MIHQKPLPEDEIGYVIICDVTKPTFLNSNNIIVTKIRAAEIFPDRAAADHRMFEIKDSHPIFKDLYDNKLFRIKPVRVSIIIPDA